MSKFIVFCGNSPPGLGAINGGQELAVPFEFMPKAAKKRFGLLPADA